jgi:hypothetical protein
MFSVIVHMPAHKISITHTNTVTAITLLSSVIQQHTILLFVDISVTTSISVHQYSLIRIWSFLKFHCFENPRHIYVH